MKYLCLAFILMLTQSCTPSYQVEVDFFEHHSWRGVVPGKTTIEEFTSYADSLLLHREQSGVTIWQGNGSSEVFFEEDNLISKIQLSGPIELKLGDIIDQLGPTDYAVINPSDHDTAVILELYYPAQGYAMMFNQIGGVEVNQFSEDEIEICFEASDFTRSITLFPVNQSIHHLLTDLGDTQETDDLLLAKIPEMKAWPGFTCIQYPQKK